MRVCINDIKHLNGEKSKMNYEYKFEKIKLGWFASKSNRDYHDIIAQYARDGWRLVQIFAPGIGIYGAPTYYELIFERPVN